MNDDDDDEEEEEQQQSSSDELNSTVIEVPATFEEPNATSDLPESEINSVMETRQKDHESSDIYNRMDVDQGKSKLERSSDSLDSLSKTV